MKISEVINKLQEIQKEHGDLHVWRIRYEDMTEINIKVIHTDDYYGLMII